MNPLSAGIGAEGSVVGSVLGLFGQNATNKMNWKINQSNQKFSADQATLSYQRKKQLIQNQNEYYSPQNQKKLMLDAGLKSSTMSNWRKYNSDIHFHAENPLQPLWSCFDVFPTWSPLRSISISPK